MTEHDDLPLPYWTPYAGEAERWMMLLASVNTLLVGLIVWFGPLVVGGVIALTGLTSGSGGSQGFTDLAAGVAYGGCCLNIMTLPALACALAGAWNVWRFLKDFRLQQTFHDRSHPDH